MEEVINIRQHITYEYITTDGAINENIDLCPKRGDIFTIYDENDVLKGIKIGDGKKTLGELPFVFQCEAVKQQGEGDSEKDIYTLKISQFREEANS